MKPRFEDVIVVVFTAIFLFGNQCLGQTFQKTQHGTIWTWNDTVFCERVSKCFISYIGKRADTLLRVEDNTAIASIAPWDSGFHAVISIDNQNEFFNVNCLTGNVNRHILPEYCSGMSVCAGDTLMSKRVGNTNMPLGYSHELFLNDTCIDTALVFGWQFISSDGKYAFWPAGRGVIGFIEIAKMRKGSIDSTYAPWGITYCKDTLHYYKGSAKRTDTKSLFVYGLDLDRPLGESNKYKKLPRMFEESNTLKTVGKCRK